MSGYCLLMNFNIALTSAFPFLLKIYFLIRFLFNLSDTTSHTEEPVKSQNSMYVPCLQIYGSSLHTQADSMV